MEIVVDYARCQNHGQCAFAAPHLFAIGDDGNQQVLVRHPDESQRGDAEDAAAVCPTQAITIEG